MAGLKKFLKKEPMLIVAVAAAIISLFITPPTTELFTKIDWHTLGTLFMMLTVLEGFKQESLFNPIIRLSSRFGGMRSLSLFLVFGVFFSSMFVTNDVSLIIFVPLTILLFRGAGREECILPVITFENIAAIRGSLLMPFGSPQNLFLYQQSGTSALNFMLHMSPLCIGSAILLIVFICVMYRKEHGRRIEINTEKITEPWETSRRKRRVSYLALFVMILATIVSRTQFWYIAVVIVIAVVLIVNRKLFLSVDYVLLLTFFCFFVFSSSITGNEAISSFLHEKVAGNEYWWSIILSQFISNVPASIVLYPFTENFTGLIYGLDTAGLCSIIGSLASVINYRIYIREYPGHGKAFLRTFMWISWAFFLIVVVPGWLLTAWKFF
ncbi:MAG: hypothetical protein K5655_07815 [Lachnospiraceae bacterium]|nr:hypothetical protein [Lachnospiraceae bacterium]